MHHFMSDNRVYGVCAGWSLFVVCVLTYIGPAHQVTSLSRSPSCSSSLELPLPIYMHRCSLFMPLPRNCLDILHLIDARLTWLLVWPRGKSCNPSTIGEWTYFSITAFSSFQQTSIILMYPTARDGDLPHLMSR